MVSVYNQTYLSSNLLVYSLLCMCVQASGLAHQTFSLLYTVDDVCTLMLQPIETHCACANHAMRGRAAAEHSLQANKSSSVGFTACGDQVCWFSSTKRMEDSATRVIKRKRTSLDKLDKLRDALFNECQPDTLQRWRKQHKNGKFVCVRGPCINSTFKRL